jgi:hypothetical protein
MKITSELGRAALALLFAVTIGTAQARAQKSAEGKTVSTPSPSANVQESPSPLPARPAEDKLAPARWTRYEMSVAESGVYGVSYIDSLPAALMNEERKRMVFERFVQEFAEGFQARMKERGTPVTLTMSERRTATLGGVAGYEQDFSYGQVMGRVRLVFDAGSAYAVLAIWNGLSPNSERNAFFESLKVNAKR